VTGFAHQETIGLRRLFVLAQSGRKQLNICQRVNIQETKIAKMVEDRRSRIEDRIRSAALVFYSAYDFRKLSKKYEEREW
jgi:hypothetical protein